MVIRVISSTGHDDITVNLHTIAKTKKPSLSVGDIVSSSEFTQLTVVRASNLCPARCEVAGCIARKHVRSAGVRHAVMVMSVCARYQSIVLQRYFTPKTITCANIVALESRTLRPSR